MNIFFQAMGTGLLFLWFAWSVVRIWEWLEEKDKQQNNDKAVAPTGANRVKAVYSIFGQLSLTEFDTLAQAKRTMYELEEAGKIYAVGVYSPDTQTAHIVENMAVGEPREALLNYKLCDFKRLGLTVAHVRLYTFHNDAN